jgi:hypothetical protein
MRFLLGCLGVAFVIFGGCVLAVLGSEGMAVDEVAFVIGAAVIFLFGIWALYKAVTMRPAATIDDDRQSGSGPSD